MKSFSSERLSSMNFLTLIGLGLQVGSTLLVNEGGTLRAVGRNSNCGCTAAIGEIPTGGQNLND